MGIERTKKLIRKDKKKILIFSLFIFFLGFVAFFGWRHFFRPSSQVLSNVDVTSNPDIKDENGKPIDFTYTDDNNNENLIIKTDEKNYWGISSAEVHFSVTNIGKKEENIGLQAYLPEKNGEVKKLEKSNQEDWQEIALSNESLPVKGSIIDRIFHKDPNRKPVPKDLHVEKSTGDEKIQIASGETQYFKMKVGFPPSSSGEFYLEAIGDKGGYGLLDPWWSSSWSYRKKITIDHDRVGILSNLSADASSGQKNVVVKDGSLFSAGKSVVIKDDSHSETNTVSSVAGNTVTMQNNLANTYTTSANGFVKNVTDSANLTNFPVLVSLSSDTDLAADAQDDGDDIAFADNSNPQTQLNHEIENFNGTTGELEAWVKIPTLSVSSDTIIYMYYGNAGASNQQNVSGTWDSNYGIVWHSKDLTTSTVKDSTTSNNTGNKQSASHPSEATGQIFKGQSYNGSSDYILSSGAFWSAPTNWTADVWFNASSTSGVVVDWLGQAGINTGYHDSGIELVGGTVYVRFWNLSCTSIGTVTTGTWNHVVVRYSGGSLTGYLNGVQGNTTSGSLTPNGTMYVALGPTDSTNCGSGAYFNGTIDEFRWSNSARGTDWIKTSEKNQRFPSTFSALGAEESIPETLVSARGTQTTSLAIPSSNQYVGGSFVIQSSSGSRNVTGMTITENGTVNAQTNLSNVKLYYENDTSAPYDCASESYAGTESQFGSTGSFNGADGTASFSGTSVGISTTSTMCVYAVLDIGSGAANNETLELKINDPSTDVTVSSGTVSNDMTEISGTTTLLTPANPTQIHYRWRNDDNGEQGNNPVWGDSNYSYRKKITITGQSGAGTDYQVKLMVGESSGSSGANFNLGGHVLSSFNDLRFTDNDGSTLLDYWIQSVSGTTPNQTATVWVEVRDDLGSNTDIFAYYGYSSAAAYSNGGNTFLFFDDFDDGSMDINKWTLGGSMTESGGYASGVTSGTDYFFGKTRININTSTVIRMQDKAASGYSARPGILQSPGNPYLIPGFGWQDYSDSYRYTDTYESGITQQQHTQFGTNWHILESTWQTSSCLFYVDGSLYATHTTQIPVSSRVLYAQVEGNANYDYIFTRKYISTEPAFSSAAAEETPTAGATFAASEDAELTSLSKQTIRRLRFEISNEGGQTASSFQYRLEVSGANPASCSSASYERLSTDADWDMAASAYITDGEATFDISPGLTNENTTFQTGEMRDTADETGAISLTNTQFTELEYSLEATTSSSDGATYCFRLTNAGSTSGFSYPEYAEVSLEGPLTGDVNFQGSSNINGSFKVY